MKNQNKDNIKKLIRTEAYLGIAINTLNESRFLLPLNMNRVNEEIINISNQTVVLRNKLLDVIHNGGATVVYACGYEHKPNSFGMFHGPNPSLEEMLEVVPDEPENNPCLIKFTDYPEGTNEILYRWKNNKWKPVKHD